MEEVILRHGYISIPNYTMGQSKILENTLSVFDDIYHRFIPIGYYYDEEKRELRVPAGVGVNYVARLLNRRAEVDFSFDPPTKAIVTLKKEPRSVSQKRIISFLVGEGEFTCNAKYAQIGIIAGTGQGKTYCAIAALSFLRTNTMIVNKSDKLRTQWKKKAMEYTNLSDNDIVVLDSSAKIERLMKSKKKPTGKLFSVTHSTLDSFASRNSWDKVGELFAYLGIGCVIIDEVHRMFANTVRLLTHINTKKIFILTATFSRSEYKENKIFNLCFKTVPLYEQRDRDGIESQKHITGIFALYNSHPSMAVEMSCNGPKGLSKTKYADYLVDNDMEFIKILSTYVKHFTINGGLKTLILCGSIKACDGIALILKEMFPKKTIGVYHSKVKASKEEKETLLEMSDIICSLGGSIGEGSDINNLRCIISMEASRSDVNSTQIPGRLRDLGDDGKYFYIEIINTGFEKVMSQFRQRKKVYKENFGEIKIIKH